MSDRGERTRQRPGQVLSIASHANPRIKAIKALALPKRRRESGLFIAEGLKLVTDALDSGWTVRAFIHRSEALEQPVVAQAAARARARGADILSVTSDILAKVTRRENPQTVVGVIEQRLVAPDAIDAVTSPLWVALEAVRDPGNLGTIIRTIDGVGANGVILVGSTVDPFSIEAVRATMGSIFSVPIARMSVDEFAGFARTWSGSVVGTHLSGATDYRTAEYPEPVLLVMGNEQAGLSEEAAALCGTLVRIPMAGEADSLNLAVATALMLYEIRRDKLPTVTEPN